MGDSKLSGSLDNLVGATSLVALVVNSNSFSGTLSSRFGQLTNLEQLLLYQNHLTGSIPETLGQLTKLQVLKLVRRRDGDGGGGGGGGGGPLARTHT